MDAVSLLFVPILLAVARFSPVLLLPGLTPFNWAPATVRTAFALALAWLVAAGATAATPASLPALGIAVAGEFLFGLTLAYAIQLPFAALGFTGRLVDVQVGFGASGIFDPSTANLEAYTGLVLTLAATALLFALDLHLALVAGLARSIELVPLGAAALAVDAPQLFALTGVQFVYAFLVVAPVVIGLLVLDLGIAYAARAMPQANVYFLSLPLKIAVGLVLLAASLQHAGAALARLLESALRSGPWSFTAAAGG